jgi:hypothetical protein
MHTLPRYALRKQMGRALVLRYNQKVAAGALHAWRAAAQGELDLRRKAAHLVFRWVATLGWN